MLCLKGAVLTGRGRVSGFDRRREEATARIVLAAQRTTDSARSRPSGLRQLTTDGYTRGTTVQLGLLRDTGGIGTPPPVVGVPAVDRPRVDLGALRRVRCLESLAEPVQYHATLSRLEGAHGWQPRWRRLPRGVDEVAGDTGKNRGDVVGIRVDARA